MWVWCLRLLLLLRRECSHTWLIYSTNRILLMCRRWSTQRLLCDVYLFKVVWKSLFRVVFFLSFHNDKSLLNLFMNERQHTGMEEREREASGVFLHLLLVSAIGRTCAHPSQLIPRQLLTSHEAKSSERKEKSTRWQMTNPSDAAHDHRTSEILMLSYCDDVAAKAINRRHG